MSDFLAEQQIIDAAGLRAGAHQRRSRSGRRRQRHLARQSRARGSARPQDPLLLAARGGPRPFSLGRALGRHRRHARQDDDDVADRLAPDARRRRSERAHRRHRRQLRRRATASAAGREFVIEGDEYDSAFFDKTAKFLKYLPDIAVVNNVEYDHADIYPDLESIRLAFRRLVNLIPRRGLLLLGADDPEARALGDGARCPRRDLRPLRRRRLAGARSASWRRARRHSACGRKAEPVGDFEVPLLGRVQRPERAGGDRGRRRGRPQHRHDRAGLARVQGRPAAHGAARHGRAGRGVRRFRASSDRDCRDARRRCVRRIRTARIWAIFEPRSATSCRSVFQSDFARAFADADRILLPAVFRSTLPEDQRLSAEQLVADLNAARQGRASHPAGRRHRRRPSRARRGRAIWLS